LASAVISAGTLLSVGGVESLTVTVKVADPVFPCKSVAVQVTIVWPTGNTDPELGLHEAVSEPSTMSKAVAEENVTSAPVDFVASTVLSAGAATVGPMLSFTVTLNVPDPLLCRLSAAVHVTVVCPTGNVAPEAGEQAGVIEPSTRSVAETPEKGTAAPPDPLASKGPMFAGTWTIGPNVSLTVTVKVSDAVLPCASTAVHLTTVEPRANGVPDAGVQGAEIDGSTLSVAVAGEKTTMAPPGPVASTVEGLGG
jgi:hypothetical protein